jgi:hypothetical protein
MKKKPLNIILLVLLIVIWGGVIYKHFGRSIVVKGTPENISGQLLDITKKNFVKDTFQLHLTNKNPFKTAKPSSHTKPKAITKPLIKVKPKARTKPKWPNMTYHGFVKGNKNNTRLVLLKIDNKLYRKREKETIKGITLIKVYNDSLKVSYQNNIKHIKKNHG